MKNLEHLKTLNNTALPLAGQHFFRDRLISTLLRGQLSRDLGDELVTRIIDYCAVADFKHCLIIGISQDG